MNDIYGFCPVCSAPGISRARRLNGNDRCKNGHVYSSYNAMSNPVDDACEAMSDILTVLRLRSSAIDQEAAKEIERLRADLTRQIEITTQQANEIERLRALTEWRPIESAPKDGTKIMLCHPGCNPHQGWWEDEYGTGWAVSWVWNSVTVRYEPERPKYKPTLWLPLLLSPKE